MTEKNSRLQTIDALVSETLSIIDMMADIQDISGTALGKYRTTCLDIPRHIESGRLRVAVVGVIKSGKSTLINSLLGKDTVKRGAGVVTAITTRIRKGKKNKARLLLKSWDEINGILRTNLELFSDDPGEKAFISALDLRRKKDREFLAKALKRLKSEFPVIDQGIHPETLSIQHALEGYNGCKDIVQADETELVFESRAFEKHKNFTANAAHAFFVKDACLEIFGTALEPQMEMADCQGADSTDPAQLTQVIQYLERANLIIYCISSRTGLRKSDMEFLKTIKRMGLLDNLIFVNNCDLSEHENLQDLKAIEDRIRLELTFLMDSPQLFGFSALMDLFENQSGRITKRNAKQLELWQEDKAMAERCRRHCKAFKKTLNGLLENDYLNLLVSNHLERLALTLEDLQGKTELLLKLTSSDALDRKEANERLDYVRENATRLKSIVENSVEGAISGLVREIKGNLDALFSKKDKGLTHRIRQHIHNAPMDVEPYRPQVKDTGLKQILYLMFQDFKRDLDLFLIQDIIPEIKALIREQELRITTYFQSLLDSYRMDPVHWEVASRHHDLTGISDRLEQKQQKNDTTVDIKAIKKILGLELPPPLFSPRFTQKMKTNALTGLSLQSISLLIRSLFKKQVKFSFSPGFDQAGRQIKKESLVAFTAHMEHYKKELFDQYFMPLIDAVTRDFNDKIEERFAFYDALNQDMDRVVKNRHGEQAAQREELKQIKERIQSCLAKVETL